MPALASPTPGMERNTAREMLHAADRACYDAKEAGRNRIEIAAASTELRTTGRFDLVKAAAAASGR